MYVCIFLREGNAIVPADKCLSHDAAAYEKVAADKCENHRPISLLSIGRKYSRRSCTAGSCEVGPNAY